ncbi:MAG: heavy metal translocating P-type ATPase, partial [Syntrophomonadaceae bacterium]|nr:heavy metal translocating P-type ATPase [Syntrophomonadaceae bacterium]
ATINGHGSLEIQVSKLARDNTISRVINLVEEAQAQRSPSQQLIDRFSRYYTPLVIAAAVLVAAVPVLVFNQPFSKWFYEALAMLLVACPCALVISTPVSVVSAIGSAARSGVLVKGGAHLEEMGRLSVIAFDKTGTLTLGKLQVTDVIPVAEKSGDEILSVAAAIESRSKHLLAEAIAVYAGKRLRSIPTASNFEAVWGRGAVGEIDGKRYYIGNSRFFIERGYPLDEVTAKIDDLQNEGKTAMILGDENRILGLIAVADELKDNSKAAIEELKKIGIKKTVMLTGDNEQTAGVIARRIGIDDYRADLLPEDKVEAITEFLAEYPKVAMVGDGVNDAPAMARATVGIAMGAAGADAALETADIVLMSDDLNKLPYIIKLGRRTLRIIRQNIVFALVIKVSILLLVIPGWLTLWLAVVGDMGSSLVVTINGMRLLRNKHE